MNENTLIQSISEKERELMILTAKRLMKPNTEYSRRMNQLFHELYELTNDPIWKL